MTAEGTERGRGAPARVLVIEDDRILGDVIARYLAHEGMAVDVVANGREGLERALATLPDLVVLDLMLPGLNGIEVFKRLRQAAPIPVVMLTRADPKRIGSPGSSSAPTTMSRSRSHPESSPRG